MRLNETDMPKGRLFIYNFKISIQEHLSGKYCPEAVINNLIPTVGRQHIVSGVGLDTVTQGAIGDGNAARTLNDTLLDNELFRANITDAFAQGTKRVTSFFVGSNEGNFTHREFGLFAGGFAANSGILISTLLIVPEFVKTSAVARTYIHEMGWF